MTPTVIYWTNALPDQWVVEDENGSLWIVPSTTPVRDDSQRNPYRGYRNALQLAEPQASILRLIGGA